MGGHRAATCPMRVPPNTADVAWAATAVTRGIYPLFTCDIYYYAIPLPITLPVHALNFAQDFWAGPGAFWYRTRTPNGHGINVGPTFMWDGVQNHRYGNYLPVNGSSLLPFGPYSVGINVSTQAWGPTPRQHFRGRKFFSPVPLSWIGRNQLLTAAGRSNAHTFAATMYEASFISEGNEWFPAIFANRLLFPVKLITDVTVSWDVHFLRRRLRQGPWEARLFYPAPFPTPSG